MNKKYQFLIGILIFITCTAFGMTFFNFAISEFSNLIVEKIEEKNKEKYQALVSTVRNDVLMDDVRSVKSYFDSSVDRKQISGYKIIKGQNTEVASSSLSKDMQDYHFLIQYNPERDWGKIIIFDKKLGSEEIKNNILSEYFSYFAFFVLLLSVVIYKMISFMFSEINPLLKNFVSRNELIDVEGMGFKQKIFKPLILTLNHTSQKIKDFEEERISYESEKAQLDLGRKIAHDIRSPLEALKVASSNEGGKELVDMAVSRIETIANDLLDQTRNQKTVVKDEISKIVEKLCHEKQLVWKNSADISVDNQLNKSFKVDVRLSRILSNLMNNSWEASQRGNIQINVKLIEEKDAVKVSLKDNGIGMNSFQLQKVLKDGGSIGKEKGNAIGVSSAIQFMKQLGGELQIESSPGQGTQVLLIFPNS